MKESDAITTTNVRATGARMVHALQNFQIMQIVSIKTTIIGARAICADEKNEIQHTVAKQELRNAETIALDWKSEKSVITTISAQVDGVGRMVHAKRSDLRYVLEKIAPQKQVVAPTIIVLAVINVLLIAVLNIFVVPPVCPSKVI